MSVPGSSPATRRASWWLAALVPGSMMSAVFVLGASGAPMAPAVLGLFAVLIAGSAVAVGVRHRRATVLHVVALPGVAGLLPGPR
ncbi:UNVERIFIED_CONTAM: hypothetical protein RF648_06280 [Kocuria sp. CPCC 205274]